MILVVLAKSSLSASCWPHSNCPVVPSPMAQALHVTKGGAWRSSAGSRGRFAR